MIGGAPHYHQIDTTAQRFPQRLTTHRVAARGGLASPAGNGPRVPSRFTSFAGAPQSATAAGLPVTQGPAATHLFLSDASRHGPIGVGTSLGLFGVPLFLGRADQARHHSLPSTHDTVPTVRPACRTAGNMRQDVAAVEFNRNQENEGECA